MDGFEAAGIGSRVREADRSAYATGHEAPERRSPSWPTVYGAASPPDSRNARRVCLIVASCSTG